MVTTASTALVWNTAGNSGLYYAIDSAQGKPRSRTYYDVLGRVVATSIKNINNLESRMEKTYDSFGSFVWRVPPVYRKCGIALENVSIRCI